MTFNEASTLEAFIRDQLLGGVTRHTAAGSGLARRNRQMSGLGSDYLAAANLTRQPQEVLVDDHLREALIRLNPSIAAQSDRADGALYRLLAIVMTVRDSGLVPVSEQSADSSLDVSNGGVFE